MPSPIGHALGGVIVALLLAPRPVPHDGHDGHVLRNLRVPRAWGPVLGWCAVAACLPDIDFAWGRHSMETHSVGFGLIVGAAAGLWTRSGRAALAVTLAVCTHPLFDWLGSDDSPPLGVMALWPFSTAFFYADVWLFPAISRRYWRDDFVTQNVLAILWELVILLPILWAAWLVRSTKGAKGTKGTKDTKDTKGAKI